MKLQEEAGVCLKFWSPVHENYCDSRQETNRQGLKRQNNYPVTPEEIHLAVRKDQNKPT